MPSADVEHGLRVRITAEASENFARVATACRDE